MWAQSVGADLLGRFAGPLNPIQASICERYPANYYYGPRVGVRVYPYGRAWGGYW